MSKKTVRMQRTADQTITKLKLTSQGLFDGEKFAFTTLEVTE